MKKLIIKILIMTIIVYSIIFITNYYVDIGNLYHNDINVKMAEALVNENICEWQGDEGKIKEVFLSKTTKKYDTAIIGSSKILYLPFEFDNYINMGLSSSKLGNYYSQIGLLEHFNKLPRHIIIGIDYRINNSDPNKDDSYNSPSVKQYGKNLFNKIHNKNLISIPILTKFIESVSFSYFQASVISLLKNGLPNNKTSEKVVICDNVEPIAKNKVCPNMLLIMSTKTYNTGIQANDNTSKSIVQTGNIQYEEHGIFKFNERNFNYFVDLIEYLLSKDIKVEFYLPADYPLVRDYINNTPSLKGVDVLEQQYRNYAKSKGIIVHGSYNPYKIGLEKGEFADTQHAKPEAMLKSFNYIE